MKFVYNFVLPEVDFALRTDKMSFLEFWQKNTLFGKTNYNMFHYSLRVIDEPKTSEIRILKLYHKKSILVHICRQSLLIGRALHQYRRGQGFESRRSLNFFSLSFRNCISSVCNCDDHPSFNSSLRSSHIWFSHIHNFKQQCICYSNVDKWIKRIFV